MGTHIVEVRKNGRSWSWSWRSRWNILYARPEMVHNILNTVLLGNK